MYDRYTIASSGPLLEKTFQIRMPAEYLPMYNAAPTNRLPVLIQSNPGSADMFQWGFIGALSNNKTISSRLFNLPAHTAFERPMYRSMLQSGRCLILADGFYTWKQVGKKQKVPYFCYFNNRQPFGIAGIWEESDDMEGVTTKSFNMLTVSATHTLREYQEDMPALLKPDEVLLWLNPESDLTAAEALIKNCTAQGIHLHAVSPLLTNSSINDERLIKPAAPSDQHGNYTLFS